MARRLPLFGIRTVGQYAALPKNEVQRQFGKHGVWVHKLAKGDDPRPVKLYHKPPSIRLNHPFDEPITNRLVLDAILDQLCQQLVTQLDHQMGNHLSLILHFENGSTAEQSITLRHRSADAGYFAQNFQYLVSNIPIQRGIAEVEVRLGGISKPNTQQASLFDDYRPSLAELSQILRQLRERYGAAYFVQASIDNPNARIPERRFRFHERDDR